MADDRGGDHDAEDGLYQLSGKIVFYADPLYDRNRLHQYTKPTETQHPAAHDKSGFYIIQCRKGAAPVYEFQHSEDDGPEYRRHPVTGPTVQLRSDDPEKDDPNADRA